MFLNAFHSTGARIIVPEGFLQAEMRSGTQFTQECVWNNLDVFWAQASTTTTGRGAARADAMNIAAVAEASTVFNIITGTR